MKIAVVAANGKAGRKIVDEALSRGIEVVAFGRGENKTSASNYVRKDLFDLTKEDLSGYDAVVDAFGAWTEETLHLHGESLARLCDLLSGTSARLLVVGGAGSLYLDETRTSCLSDAPNFPESFKPLASAMAKALSELRERSDVAWTYVSPAADFQADGARTGKYLLGGEEFATNDRGESAISYADYAIAIVDELEKGANIRRRISAYGA
ncbi:MAG: NAD(P)H-binding protein [Thermoguttaceae bacterium]|nr:NAD(P)H-binding protein [Thermoguttaceae bacterium]